MLEMTNGLSALLSRLMRLLSGDQVEALLIAYIFRNRVWHDIIFMRTSYGGAYHE